MFKRQVKRLCAVVSAVCLLCGIVPFSVSAAEISAPADGNFSFLWVSDPQIYTNEYQHILSAQNDWILDNANRLNVKYAIHTGDLVHVYSDTSQWDFVSSEYKKWDDAGFSYGVLAGNHDMSGTDYSLYSKYFGKARYESNWWYGGDYKDNYGHYDLRSTGGADFIFVYLSYGNHTQEDLAWVNSVLKEHSNRIAILAVHEYMATTGGRSEQGDVLFEEVVLKNPNVRMVLCGHNYNSNRAVDEIDDNGDGKADRTVYQIMANYQYTSNGGNGFIRFMECDVAGGTITHRTYSPYTASFGSDYEDGTILDEYGYRDEFVTPFDFSNPAAKAEGDPESGTVVYTSQMSFAPTASYGAVTLPVVYQNRAETGATYQGVGVYDRFFSLDAADAFTDPSALNYVVTEYTARAGCVVTKVIKGSTLGSSQPQVPIPHNGAVVVLPSNAAVDLNTITVGRKVMLNKLTAITPPTAIKSMYITVPSWGGVYNIDSTNRVTGNDEWIIYDSLSTATYTHEWDMLFAFSPVSGKTYRLTAANTAIGAAKSLAVPTNGFVLAVNTCSAESRFGESMEELFKNGLQVTLEGYTPGVKTVHTTTSLLAPSVSKWTRDSTMVVAQSGGAQVFYNTDSQWPTADYTYTPSIELDPSSVMLQYDYMLETDARTSIMLFFKGSSEEYVSLQKYFDGATLSTKSGDAKGDDIRRTGKIDLTTMEVPAACYNADGTLTLDFIRIFASGTAQTKLHIYTLALTTDMSAGEEEVIPQNVPLLGTDVAVSDSSKKGGYVYDNGALTVTSESDSGYEVVVTLDRRFDVSSLSNLLLKADSTVRFDIQPLFTTAGDDARYGLVSDFWPNLCEARDNGFIPAGKYDHVLDLKSCFTWNNVLPADGFTTAKQVRILLGGQGVLKLNALQVSNVTECGRFADGVYQSVTTPSVSVTSNVYTIDNGYVHDVASETTVATLLANVMPSIGLTIKDNGVVAANDAIVKTGMTLHVSATDMSWTIVVKGDVNSDGRATTLDARYILMSVLGIENLTDAQNLAADYDDGGDVNSLDARRLLMTITG